MLQKVRRKWLKTIVLSPKVINHKHFGWSYFFLKKKLPMKLFYETLLLCNTSFVVLRAFKFRIRERMCCFDLYNLNDVSSATVKNAMKFMILKLFSQLSGRLVKICSWILYIYIYMFELLKEKKSLILFLSGIFL